MFQKVKGVSDNFFDMPYWTSVKKKIETHLQRYNFSPIDIPILEHVSLFERGLGYQTDVVSKQMFVMQSRAEHADTDPICLRPEATAGTMRAFLEEQSKISLPCKVFCYGPMFRYERPQKGRLRQFHQMNLEMIGGASILYDAQFIKMLQTLFSQTLQMQDFILKINFLGELQDRKKFEVAFINFLQPKKDQLCDVCKVRLDSNPLRVLDCKSLDCQALCMNAPKLSDFFSEQTQAEWQLLQDSLQELCVTFIIDDHLVRGLDYYNKTVFEFVSVSLGAQNAFCGGGRYDGLAQQLGSKACVPAIGAGIGMERLTMILQHQKDQLTDPVLPLICVIPLTDAQNKLALHVADFLTTSVKSKSVEVLLDDAKIKNKMKRANDLKATWVLLLGDDEQKNNTVTIKNMITGIQEVVLQKNVINKL